MINIDKAKSYLGRPYVWGGESMSEGGFDCSGYVYNVLRDCGYNIPRDTAQGYFNRFKNNLATIDEVGVLLFFGKSISNITHIAIGLGDGTMIESIGAKKNNKNNPGKGVTISKITRRKDYLVAKLPYDKYQNVSRETLDVLPLPKPTLRRGDMGVEVERLQRILMRYGYPIDKIGVYDNSTYRAVADFQYKRKDKLRIDGIYDNNTHEVLRGEGKWK